MTRIQILPDLLIDKIAAGEVVERPASVVKELVENALDAGATTIDIELSEGGRKSILVRDNGGGIDAAELKLAASRHATSKIRELEDLDNIATMGFRGEALASIAAVSHLTITSRVPGKAASHLAMEGGKLVSEGDCGHPDGTSVAVKYLFFNIPARLKFLKTPETELSHIIDYVTRSALTHPEVAYTLTHEGKNVLRAPLAPDLNARVSALVGKETAKNSFSFSKVTGDVSIAGLAGHPQVSRSHAREMYLFVNSRPVKDKTLHHAVLEAYRDVLMKGRYPFVVLYVNLPGTMVDVNVHPAKTEVRFAQGSVIHNLVKEAIRSALMAEPWKKNESQPSFVPTAPAPFASAPRESYASLPFYERSSTGPVPESNDNTVYGQALRTWDDAAPVMEARTPASADERQVDWGRLRYGELTIIGQFLATYIVCQLGDKLVLVDQHAAHERVGFEKLMLQYREGQIASQSLLIPENIDLKPSETEILKKMTDELLAFGFDVEFFGGNTFVVRAVPALMVGRLSTRDLIVDLVGDMVEKGSLTTLKDKLHHMLATMACHGAIRAHHALTIEEMRALLKELDQYQFTSFCPHGRPAAVEIEKSEVERWFKRIV